jgi:hypothetical protein
LVSVLLSPAVSVPAEPPSDVKAQYKIYKSGILIGNVSEHFTSTGDRYRIVSATQTAGALAWLLRDRLTITSEGRIGSTGLEPAQYEFRREKDQAKNLTAIFDWDRQQIVSQHDGKSENFDLPRGTLDRVSAMYQFMFNAPKTPEVLTWMSQGKKAERYVYRKQGEPVLTIGGTRYPTVHYAREAQPGESHAELWLAKNMHYLPVRMVFEDSHGLALEQSLVSLTTE